MLLAVGCKEKFDIPVNSSKQSLLVVEGVLNAGTGPTTINLSRTINLDRRAQEIPELLAQVKVEGNDNSSVQLTENGSGVYSHAQLNLDLNKLYRLRIRTSAGKEYLSDFVPVKSTPDIDSVSWKQDNEGVKLFANTHDPSNNTRYYQWDYSETWEIQSTYFAFFKFVNKQVIPRNIPAEQVFVCWKNQKSTSLFLGSSARLQSDIINDAPLLEIPRAAEKLSIRYSILVRQYALTREAYDFYQVMKRNTESLGTIFDAQPSEVKGNIHNVSDPNETVIGLVTACQVKEKRIFINNSQLTNWGFYMSCPNRFVDNNPDSIEYYIPMYLPYESTGNGYMVSYPECVDCTTRGGSTTKPSFW
jgi:hypothetical protein